MVSQLVASEQCYAPQIPFVVRGSDVADFVETVNTINAHYLVQPNPSAVSRFAIVASALIRSWLVLVREIRASGHVFSLNEPVYVTLSSEDGGIWCCQSGPLGISAFGRSKDEALSSFHEDFSVLWEAIGQAPDESLTADALVVKREFHRVIGSVEAK